MGTKSTTPAFMIETIEFEKDRHVFDMWCWINEKMAAMREYQPLRLDFP